jgi:spore coat protein U-like protein
MKHWRMLVLLSVCVVRLGVAQKINFGAYTTSQGISLVTSGTALNFNDKQPIIVSNYNTTVTIALTDNETQYIQIVADATRDITITISAPLYMITGGGGTGYQVPFTCSFAYSNLGSADAATAKNSAIQIPAGFTAIPLPVLKRAAGVPAPPPTPAHGGYSPPQATAYLFLYGTLGPVGNVSAGSYTGTINVTINYTTY